MRWLWLASALAVGPAASADPGATPGGAQPAPPAAEDVERQAAEKRRLEEEVTRQLGAEPPAAPVPPPPPAAGGATGGNPVARLLLLPDISVIGSGAMVWSQKDVETLSPRGDPVGPAGKVQPVFQELEVALQAVVDPYVRADVFLTFGPDGAGAEEAYLTTLGLPGGFQVRAGKLKAPFGRLNQQHPHVWDFAGAPLPMARLLAVDALGGPGLDVAWLAPLPWFAELHLAYQETVPGFEVAGRRTGMARLLQYFDLADGLTLGLGFSAARLDEPGPGAWRDLGGADLFLKFRPPTSRAYLALQGELFVQRLRGTGDPLLDVTHLGGYAQALVRTSAFWSYGVRWESAPTGAPDRSGPENRWTGLVTWYPSEFLRLRLQASQDRLPGGATGWESLLAMEFVMGAHGAHPF